MWVGTNGPTACPARVTCNVVYPTVTIDVTTTPGKIGPSATATPTGALIAEAGKSSVELGGMFVAAFIAALGML